MFMSDELKQSAALLFLFASCRSTENVYEP